MRAKNEKFNYYQKGYFLSLSKWYQQKLMQMHRMKQQLEIRHQNVQEINEISNSPQKHEFDTIQIHQEPEIFFHLRIFN